MSEAAYLKKYADDLRQFVETGERLSNSKAAQLPSRPRRDSAKTAKATRRRTCLADARPSRSCWLITAMVQSRRRQDGNGNIDAEAR